MCQRYWSPVAVFARSCGLNSCVENIFKRGVKHFNNHEYYAAHECFEEIWTDHKIKDRVFVQSLIQLSVAYFHITNLNKNGAISLFKKSIKKLDKYLNRKTEIDNIGNVVIAAKMSLDNVIKISDMNLFNWNLAPKLEIKKNIK